MGVPYSRIVTAHIPLCIALVFGVGEGAVAADGPDIIVGDMLIGQYGGDCAATWGPADGVYGFREYGHDGVQCRRRQPPRRGRRYQPTPDSGESRLSTDDEPDREVSANRDRLAQA